MNFSPLRSRKNIAVKASFRWKMGYRRGGVDHWLPMEFRDNLITDSGLDKVGTVSWADCFNYCLFSATVSPTPVSRAGGGVTFSQTGTTITASGSFFVSGDTGRLLKYGTGTGGAEVYLTYVNATTATASASGTVAAGTAGTVWYVNETALPSLLQATNTYDSTGGACFTSWAGNVCTAQRTYVGSALGAPSTLTQIGFNNSGANSNIFDFDVITGGVPLITGDQPLAVAQLIRTYEPDTSTTAPNVGTGCNTEGDCQLQYMGVPGFVSESYSSVQTSGNSQGGDMQAGDYKGGVRTATFSLGAFNNASGNSPSNVVSNTYSRTAYSNGNFYRDCVTSFSTSQANGSIYGLILGASTGGGSVNNVNELFTVLFDTPFTKTSAQTFAFTVRISWQRILTN